MMVNKMDHAGVRFSGSRYFNIEFNPENNKATIVAVINDTTVAGTVTLTAAKAAKMEKK